MWKQQAPRVIRKCEEVSWGCTGSGTLLTKICGNICRFFFFVHPRVPRAVHGPCSVIQKMQNFISGISLRITQSCISVIQVVGSKICQKIPLRVGFELETSGIPIRAVDSMTKCN